MLFNLFPQRKKATPEERLVSCQKKKDWAGVVRACYDLGVKAMDKHDLNRAWLWLNRADTIYSAQDEIYDAVGEELEEDCSKRIGMLEKSDMFYTTLSAQVEEKAKTLGAMQVQVWGLLSLARMVTLGRRLSVLEGCDVLNTLDWIVDRIFMQLQKPRSGQDDILGEIQDMLYTLGDSEKFFGGAEIDVPGGPAFQALDLNGMTGGVLALHTFLESHMSLMDTITREGMDVQNVMLAVDSGIITMPLLADYYVRTGPENLNLEELPQIQHEIARIWSDYDFLKAGPAWTDVGERLAKYRTLDLLQA